MILAGFPFATTDWASVEGTAPPARREHPLGNPARLARFASASSNTRAIYLTGYRSTNGHVFYCLEGELASVIAAAHADWRYLITIDTDDTHGPDRLFCRQLYPGSA